MQNDAVCWLESGQQELQAGSTATILSNRVFGESALLLDARVVTARRSNEIQGSGQQWNKESLVSEEACRFVQQSLYCRLL